MIVPRVSVVCLLVCALLLSPEHASASAKPVMPEKPDKITVTLSFAGDCTLGSDLKYGKSNSFIETYEKQKNYSYFFSNVKNIFYDDDLTIVNLEGPLTNTGVKADKEYAFRGPSHFTGILAFGGVDAANLANNHTNDYGEKGYQETVKNLQAAGIAPYGIDMPYIAEVRGVKIALLGYKAWSADSGLKNKIASDIKEMRANGANAVVCTFHGGDEGVYYPNDIQKIIYRHAIDSGADLVIGHHPHVLQGIELYNGKYIAYSLGNFCFGGNRNPSDKDTIIFRQTFEFNDKTLAKTGASAEIVPCRVSSVTNRNDFRPTPLTGEEAKKLLEKLNNYSKALNGNTDISKIIGVYER